MKAQVFFKKLRDGAAILYQAHPGDAGFDLVSVDSAKIAPGGRLLVHTGIALEIPTGFEGQIRPRSGLALKNGVTVLNSPGTVDAGYRGEICVLLVNLGDAEFCVEPGMRVAQMVIAPVAQVDFGEVSEFSASERGEGGFGSSGVR